MLTTFSLTKNFGRYNHCRHYLRLHCKSSYIVDIQLILHWNYCQLDFQLYLGPLYLKNYNFCQFLRFSATLTGHQAKKSKLKKNYFATFQEKPVHQIHQNKIRFLTLTLRTLILSQKFIMKIIYISTWGILISSDVCWIRKNTILYWSKVLLLQKVTVTQKVGAKHILKTQEQSPIPIIPCNFFDYTKFNVLR